MPRDKWASYGLALIIGLIFASAIVPMALVLNLNGSDFAVGGDATQHIIGERYFISSPWRWPLFLAPNLAAPFGTNIALVDAIPLWALVLKLFRFALPPDFQGIYSWVYICYVLQPVFAVFALRSFGERRIWPALCVALFAISSPMWLYRLPHAALCSHFLLFWALAIYGQTLAGARWLWLRYLAVLTVSLLIHPYIFAMVAGLLCAGPLSLLLARRAGWRRTTIDLVVGFVVVFLILTVLGYRHSGDAGQFFGHFAMNGLAPFYPYRSGLLPGFDKPFDYDGEYFEGYSYAGLGVIAGVVLALASGQGTVGIRRHSGMIIICLALVLFALSGNIYLGRLHLVVMTHVPDLFEQFRSSARFFWPVYYMLMLFVVLMLAHWRRPRTGMIMLGCLTLIQVADASRMMVVNHDVLHSTPVRTLPSQILTPLLQSHQRLTILPAFGCGMSDKVPNVMQLLELASHTRIPVNTMEMSRFDHQPDCAADMHPKLMPGELLVIFHDPTLSSPATDGLPCVNVANMEICSLNAAALAGIPVTAKPAMPVGSVINFQKMQNTVYLASGWSVPGDGGVWSVGQAAILEGRTQQTVPAGTLVGVWLNAVASDNRACQPVDVSINGSAAQHWCLPNNRFGYHTAAISKDILPQQDLSIHFSFPLAAGEAPGRQGTIDLPAIWVGGFIVLGR